MKYVIGIDLGTSSVKSILVNQLGEVCAESAQEYPLIHVKSGYSEQNPEEWVNQTIKSLKELTDRSGVSASDIEGISFSGQMHGLVLLDDNMQVLRNAILWNDTRTTPQCQQIIQEFGDTVLAVTRNAVLEGFTLPKMLWVQQHEPELFAKSAVFMLPKDYLRFRLTGAVHMDYSDAAGTLLLDVINKNWSEEIAAKFSIPLSICPPLVESSACVGSLLPEIADQTGLSINTKIMAGGADNACGAIGAGIVSSGKTLCSIGTSGVILSYEEEKSRDFEGKVHFFNHGQENAYYTMGVTLSAGQSLKWFKETFADGETFEEVTAGLDELPIGSGGLLFTPYLYGERTPHADSLIRASFIGMDETHTKKHFAKAVMEGITFSLQESLEIFRSQGKEIESIVSIGGGAKNPVWLQMQADIFNARVLTLTSEQGPAMGAAILAAVGSGWFESIEECSQTFISTASIYEPNPEAVIRYQELFTVYQNVYGKTKEICTALQDFRVQ